MDGWMGGWMDGWVRWAGIGRLTNNNSKFQDVFENAYTVLTSPKKEKTVVYG